ncbi:glycerophosphodiester phosphodiesterase GDPD1, chloroplastic-like isoform X1 [Zea mays]|uniref:glycerophosphodiester phosphodiesterase n=1 Tax=Zea mays TaxID=4577 RepID=C0HFH2_MAIZE|nr:uncharacterized protein LOC100383215 isoform X1 [Zea mays]ACN25775.1 unknown [Zea mays]ONM17980.1 Glycerophosphodiester phosphodiesterase GDPD2 [Zea mays]|eukprot:XP_020403474.1 uncharacterized protein LOC100383215 isoform X1 [Zea mays]
MAQLKAARATDVPPAMPDPDPDVVAADLGACVRHGRVDGLAAGSGRAEATATATTTAAAADQGRRRPPLVVVGHRGKGMNALASPDPRLRGDIRENTLRAFNAAAASHPAVAYVEFDVQAGKPLLRKLKDGRILKWDVQSEDALCTLREVFEGVHRRVGFNVELKFDDDLFYTEERLTCILKSVLKVVFEHANDRPIIFSSFQPDAAQLIRKLQDKYPVLFLTNGGTQVYADPRRNSLEEAVKLCVAGGLQGIVSEVRAILRQPSAVAKIKEANKLSLMTYGQLNNVAEVVYVQHLMGVDGVIVDLVQEIAEAVSAFTVVTAVQASGSQDGGGIVVGERMETAAVAVAGTPSFSPREVSFLLRLIPELVQ